MLYVIGYNLNGELGLKQHCSETQVDTVTNWQKITHHSNVCVKDINNSYEHTVFTTEDNEYFMSTKDNDALELNHSKIKKIYTSVNGNRNTFWIKENKKIFGIGKKKKKKRRNIL